MSLASSIADCPFGGLPLPFCQNSRKFKEHHESQHSRHCHEPSVATQVLAKIGYAADPQILAWLQQWRYAIHVPLIAHGLHTLEHRRSRVIYLDVVCQQISARRALTASVS